MKTQNTRLNKLALVAAVMLAPSVALAYVTNVYEFEGQTTNLTVQPCSNDLAQTDSISNYFEGGGFYLAAWPSCRMYMLFNATNSHHGYGPGAVGGGENMYDAGVLFADYTICTVRTDFASAKTITQIVIYAGHGCGGQGSSRSWINCDIEFSADGSTFTFFKNMKAGKIGDWISSYGDGYSNVMARLYDTSGSSLGYNIRSVRYIFYYVGWAGEFRPPATAAEATVCREIDVYGEDFVITAAPIAEFTADTTNGFVPLTVSFTDQSSNTPTYWHWQFGDGDTSAAQNPVHQYDSTGVFTVTLFCTNSLGSSANAKTNYISVVTPPLSRVAAGIWHTNFFLPGPININLAIIDLTNPAVSLETALGQDSCHGVEKTSSMAQRYGAALAVNGDYWTYGGVPLGFTVVNRELVTSPRYRTGLGITTNKRGIVGMWTDQWQWYGKARFADGYTHSLVFQNLDCSYGWMCNYSDMWGADSYGNSLSDTAEAVVNCAGIITETRLEQPGVPIPEGGFVITARGNTTNNLLTHAIVGTAVTIEQTTLPDWRNLKCAITAGPRIVQDGVFYQDPLSPYPTGEDFTASWKSNHYLYRHPRTAAAVSEDGQKLILAVADGRQSAFSIGITQREMADLLMLYGGYNAIDLDSGGSSTMVIDGIVTNHPSDYANPDGTGGIERSVANALLIFSNPYGFRCVPRRARASEDVSFIDMSSDNPTAWLWALGDGTTDTTRNTVHTFSSPGTYSVALTVTNDTGLATLTRPGYVKIGPTYVFSTRSCASVQSLVAYQPVPNDGLQIMISNAAATATLLEGGFCGGLGSLASYTDSTIYGDYGTADFGGTHGSILKSRRHEQEDTPSQIVEFSFASPVCFTNILVFGGATDERGCLNVDVEVQQSGSTDKVYITSLRSATLGSYETPGTPTGTDNSHIVAAAGNFEAGGILASDVTKVILTFFCVGNPGDDYFIDALDELKPDAVAGSIVREIDINSPVVVIPEPACMFVLLSLLAVPRACSSTSL